MFPAPGEYTGDTTPAEAISVRHWITPAACTIGAVKVIIGAVIETGPPEVIVRPPPAVSVTLAATVVESEAPIIVVREEPTVCDSLEAMVTV
jgi:hypothetical protein